MNLRIVRVACPISFLSEWVNTRVVYLKVREFVIKLLHAQEYFDQQHDL